MTTTHLASGIVIAQGRLLLVASHYPNQPQPLWNLPGGRQQPGELLVDTVVREVFEETRLRVHAGELAYVSESYDGERHFLNASFVCEASFDSLRSLRMTPGEELRMTPGEELRMTPRDHVVAVEWVALGEVRERIVVGVVRAPLLAYLQGVLERRYAGYRDAGITIEWPPSSA